VATAWCAIIIGATQGHYRRGCVLLATAGPAPADGDEEAVGRVWLDDRVRLGHGAAHLAPAGRGDGGSGGPWRSTLAPACRVGYSAAARCTVGAFDRSRSADTCHGGGGRASRPTLLRRRACALGGSGHATHQLLRLGAALGRAHARLGTAGQGRMGPHGAT
jgi:hypothetical protein